MDLESAREKLLQNGYVVLENVLSARLVEQLSSGIDEIFARERDAPFDPGDGPPHPQDEAIEKFFRENYSVSESELARLMRRIRYTRAQNQSTPWPVGVEDVNKTFLHLPTLFDDDKSQRIWNLLNKGEAFASLVEHPTVLGLVRSVLGGDCVLSDCSATSIGAHTAGGAWHVDVPLGQLPEPFPETALTMQNVWMLDDFTAENGATQVVAGSHSTRKKPQWSTELSGDTVTLTAPAGSVAVWLSGTWHRSGPNSTERPRRGIICYYSRSWIKPFNDFQAGVSAEARARMSPTMRYLLGSSASGPERG